MVTWSSAVGASVRVEEVWELGSVACVCGVVPEPMFARVGFFLMMNSHRCQVLTYLLTTYWGTEELAEDLVGPPEWM